MTRVQVRDIVVNINYLVSRVHMSRLNFSADTRSKILSMRRRLVLIFFNFLVGPKPINRWQSPTKNVSAEKK